MWEMIERMASDRLWIYTALVGSLFGLAFSTYFKSTRIGLWLQQPDDAWRQKYPYVTKKIDELEKRLKKLEGKK
jgi:hypothetical protein